MLTIPCSRPRRAGLLALLCCAALSTSGTTLAQASSDPPAVKFRTVHTFADNPDGSGPEHELLQASDGYLYGTTLSGGSFFRGSVYRLKPGGAVHVVHSFSGAFPEPSGVSSGLFEGSDGALYGTSAGGGEFGSGTVYRLAPDCTVTVLHAFREGEPQNGYSPYGGVVQASNGDLYGTTLHGGNGLGVIYRLSLDGHYNVLKPLDQPSGENPTTGLIQASDGWLYGTTRSGGSGLDDFGHPLLGGTVFRISMTGAFEVVRSFPNHSKTLPCLLATRLVQGSDGALYGGSAYGGQHDGGSAYRITSAGDVTVLHSFSEDGRGGFFPHALVEWAPGRFVGTAQFGGKFDQGTVFGVATDGAFTLLKTFRGRQDNGQRPLAGLTLANDGRLYGSTGSDPAPPRSHGTVFSLEMAGER